MVVWDFSFLGGAGEIVGGGRGCFVCFDLWGFFLVWLSFQADSVSYCWRQNIGLGGPLVPFKWYKIPVYTTAVMQGS